MHPGIVDRFRAALRAGDVERVRSLLDVEPEVRAAVNAPVGPFGERPLAMVRDNLPLVDLLIAYGADLNLKSDWWAGGFGLLEHACTPEQAAPLIARGAIVDIFAAAHLGMFERVRELVEGDASLVRARGGDGKTALHCARTVAIARFLVDCGADVDARCVDHQSTAAQYLVREAPEVTRWLTERGRMVRHLHRGGTERSQSRGAQPARRRGCARSSDVARQISRRECRRTSCDA